MDVRSRPAPSSCAKLYWYGNFAADLQLWGYPLGGLVVEGCDTSPIARREIGKLFTGCIDRLVVRSLKLAIIIHNIKHSNPQK